MTNTNLILTNDSWSRKLAKIFLDTAPWGNPFFRKLAGTLKRYSAKLVWLWVWSQEVNESFELEVFKKSVKPVMTVLDIGANIGVQTAIAARNVGKKGKVIAFEPDPFTFRLLQKRINELELVNVRLEEMALSDKEGKVNLYIDSVNPGNNSFSKKNLYAGKDSVKVSGIRLDTYLEQNKIKKVDVINIDAQGAEAIIFKGAKNFLKKTKAKIFMEYWPQGIRSVGGDPIRLLNTLSTYGFNFYILDKKKRSLIPAKKSEIVKEIKLWRHYTDYTNLLLVK